MRSGACSNACLHGSPLDLLGDPTGPAMSDLAMCHDATGPGFFTTGRTVIHGAAELAPAITGPRHLALPTIDVGLPGGDSPVSCPRIRRGLIAKTACVLHGNDSD